MNNFSTSECSSGCESGWTMYLDQSSNSADQFQKASSTGFKAANEEEYDEDEDLSMVSDASSGPRHFQEDEDSFNGNGYLCSVSGQANKKKKKKNVKEQRSKKQFSNLNLHEYLKQGKSALHKHIGFFHSSVPGKPASGAPGKSIESLLCVYWTASGF
ncbi:hypothetical protein RHGRI_016426 [Rhododendron griersonianum]|uniref:Uncharacterized protein n=1 Tax=Rhododendron griersonianum TaxID=479676 RepID=A0AAV6JU22_9ERIC|nr:hypothetical protein RHGRI_016426 [Rhododendron griersonianum]